MFGLAAKKGSDRSDPFFPGACLSPFLNPDKTPALALQQARTGAPRNNARMKPLWLFVAAATVALLFNANSNAGADHPNIVFILADDLGWAELGCYGNDFNETPNLDRLAAGGMRFTQAYAAAPVCSPYRAALLTGQYPARVGITDYLRPNSANALSTQHVTLAEALQRAGYATGMIGKWHLTGYQYHAAEHEIKPRDHGFAWDFAREVKGVGNGANFWPYVFRDQPIRWLDIAENRLGEDEFLVDRMNAEAVDFIDRHHDQPFFLYLSHYATHTILHGKPQLVDKYRDKHQPGKSSRDHCYLCQDQGHQGDALHHWAADHNPHLAAMLESIDDGIGLINNKLDQLGIRDNTIVIFTSDNGGEANVTTNGHLRGGKSELYEGGIRVPLIVRWPNRVPADSVCEQPTVNVDFYPTLLKAAEVPVPAEQTMDGVSTLSTWLDPQAVISREAIYWHYPLDSPHFLGGRSAAAIREGDWKLIEFFDSGRAELYRLDQDPSEQKNLADKHPQTVRQLKDHLATWRDQVAARTPSPPLLVQPTKLYFADSFSPQQISERWFFQKEWQTKDGVLVRNELPGENKRIFLKQPRYQDAMIRFDFQFRGAGEIRLMTGASGPYNAVVHIHPNQFFIQTAKDDSGPYFSRRHGECAFDFQPDHWYTMTVEFSGDQLVAHLDREHLAYAKHHILDKQRTYFAFQVDQPSAAFDNVQILTAKPHPDQEHHLQWIRRANSKYPVEKSLQEELKIRQQIAHDFLYQTDANYRALVSKVDQQKAKEKRLYPNVFRSHKEFQKEISQQRKRLLADDANYKETLHATYRAARAIDDYLLEQDPDIGELPPSRRSAALQRLKLRFANDAGYQKLLAVRDAAQTELEQKYPQLFRTDQQITKYRKEQRQAVNKDPEFRKLIDETAATYRAQQDYLLRHDSELARLIEAAK